MAIVALADGRRLAYEVWGDPGGWPVFLLHGTPGSRLAARPDEVTLGRLGVRLVTYDRPGYGLSDPQPGRRVAFAARDVAALADELGLERFSVAGGSGGGPHALACAALLPDRVVRAAALVSPAPYGPHGPKWFTGMAELNVYEFRAALRGRDALSSALAPEAAKIRKDPRVFIDALAADLAPSERQSVAVGGRLREMMIANFNEALRTSIDGWLDDALAFVAPWGFRPAAISVPVRLWCGADDTLVPAEHARRLRDEIPDATLEVRQDVGHFGAYEALPGILQSLTPWAGRPWDRGRHKAGSGAD